MRGNTDVRITSFYVLSKPTLIRWLIYFVIISAVKLQLHKPEETVNLH